MTALSCSWLCLQASSARAVETSTGLYQAPPPEVEPALTEAHAEEGAAAVTVDASLPGQALNPTCFFPCQAGLLCRDETHVQAGAAHEVHGLEIPLSLRCVPPCLQHIYAVQHLLRGRHS